MDPKCFEQYPQMKTDVFHHDDADYMEAVEIGGVKAQSMHFGDRRAFVHCIRALAYAGKAKEIPNSMGACTIFKVPNALQGTEDTVIVTTAGPYSALPAEESGYSEDDWSELSRRIRTVHEFTHVYARSRYPSHKEAVRDEVIADAVGLVAAAGSYDPQLAGKLLGLYPGGYHEGGRLQNYVPIKEDLPYAAQQAEGVISAVSVAWTDFMHLNAGASDMQDYRQISMRFMEYLEKTATGLTEPLLQTTVTPDASAWDMIRPVLLRHLHRLGFQEGATQLLVAAEEIFVNIVSYAFPDDHLEVRKCGITLQRFVEGERQGVQLLLTDNGIPFDPTAVPDKEPIKSVSGTSPGGYGITLARRKADAMDYKREDNRNVLTLTKYL